MDIEQSSSHLKALEPRGQPANCKVKIFTKIQAAPIDRSKKYPEIGIKVSVYSRKEASFLPAKIYFINPDVKIWEFCKSLRTEFNIIDDPKSSKLELDHYRLFFENLRLEEDKRFAELNFVSGDAFSFCPQLFAPKEASGKMTEYLTFVFSQTEVPTFNENQQYFFMSRNEFRVYPTIRELSRMTFYELGRVEKFKVENDYGRIEFLEPVDLRYQTL